MASHAANPGQRKTLSVIAVAKRDILRKTASSGSVCRKRKKERGEIRDDKGKEKVEEVNAVTYKDDGEVLFTSSLPANVLVAADQNCGQEWILDSGASFHVTPT